MTFVSEISRCAPKDSNGEIDHNTAITGDDLRDFVNGKLIPYLHSFRERASGPNTIEYKIGEIFGEITNKIQSGYNLRDVAKQIDELRFGSQAEKHEPSHLYETKIKNMGNAGHNGGENYPPRPLIRAIIEVVQPPLGKPSMMARSVRQAFCAKPSIICGALISIAHVPRGRGDEPDKKCIMDFWRDFFTRSPASIWSKVMTIDSQ